jgi:hypothetical protein
MNAATDANRRCSFLTTHLINCDAASCAECLPNLLFLRRWFDRNLRHDIDLGGEASLKEPFDLTQVNRITAWCRAIPRPRSSVSSRHQAIFSARIHQAERHPKEPAMLPEHRPIARRIKFMSIIAFLLGVSLFDWDDMLATKDEPGETAKKKP